MKRDLFRRYVWLVDTIRHAEKIQFEEIAECWLSSALNEDNSPLALRTFHNHRHAIEQLFGIRIECDRSDHHRYYICGDPYSNSTLLKIWMLQRLGYSDLDNDLRKLGKRIYLDALPEDKFGLYDVVEAMHNNNVLNFVLRRPDENGKFSIFFAPYGIKFVNNRWYVIGTNVETGVLPELPLDLLASASITQASFSLPDDFEIKEG